MHFRRRPTLIGFEEISLDRFRMFEMSLFEMGGLDRHSRRLERFHLGRRFAGSRIGLRMGLFEVDGLDRHGRRLERFHLGRRFAGSRIGLRMGLFKMGLFKVGLFNVDGLDRRGRRLERLHLGRRFAGSRIGLRMGLFKMGLFKACSMWTGSTAAAGGSNDSISAAGSMGAASSIASISDGSQGAAASAGFSTAPGNASGRAYTSRNPVQSRGGVSARPSRKYKFRMHTVASTSCTGNARSRGAATGSLASGTLAGEGSCGGKKGSGEARKPA